MDAIVGHRWEGCHLECEVRWNLGDMTWEPYTGMKELAALDDYLALQGVELWRHCQSTPRQCADGVPTWGISAIKPDCGCLVVAKSHGDSTIKVQNLKRAHPLFFINHYHG
jgi:hypothetical protein